MIASKPVAESKSDMETQWIQTIWYALRGCLEPQRDQIYEEIRSYPPPIPACDVQFNHLLEERARLSQEWSRLNAIAKQSLPWHDHLQLFDAFITESTCLTQDAKQTMQACLEEARTALAK